MAINEIKPNIYYVGAKDYNRRLFDELIPLPNGTSYNAYLVIGDKKTALIDSVDGTMFHVLKSNLKKLGIKKIDYIISNHTEQDHSESIAKLVELYPEAKVITNAKGKEHLIVHLHIPEDRFIVKNTDETLSLGNKTLKFIDAPWVHWPETMFTLAIEDKIIFTCDFFGTHLAQSDPFVTDKSLTYVSAKRYYAEIMMPFRKIVAKHLKMLENYDFDMIGPSHGPVHQDPSFIIDAYKEWASEDVKNEVIIPYVSMHHSVEEMVHYLTEALIDKGITVKPFNLPVTDIGELAMDLVDAATIILGAPAVLTGPHPLAAYATILVDALRPKAKYFGIIGSYGWKCQLVEKVLSLISRINPEVFEPIVVRGKITDKGFKALDKLANDIYEKHKALGLIK